MTSQISNTYKVFVPKTRYIGDSQSGVVSLGTNLPGILLQPSKHPVHSSKLGRHALRSLDRPCCHLVYPFPTWKVVGGKIREALDGWVEGEES